MHARNNGRDDFTLQYASLTALSLGLRLSAFGPPLIRTEGELKTRVI